MARKSMKHRICFGLCLLLAIPSLAIEAAEPQQTPAKQCDVGPITKQYANVAWLVYSCDDDQSLVIVSSPGSPAMPFVFFFGIKDGKRTIHGEGTGNKAITDAAVVELQRLTEQDIGALIAETRQVAKH